MDHDWSMLSERCALAYDDLKDNGSKDAFDALMNAVDDDETATMARR